MTRWMFNNLALKIGSVFIAALLWFHVVTERWVVETITAPIKFQDLPADLVVVNDVQSEVRFQVRTKVKQLILLTYFGSPFMRIDLSTLNQGGNTLDLSEELIVLPSWRPLEVVGIVGSRKMDVEADRRAERTVPVQPVFVGTPLEGNFLKNFKVTPDTVVLIGGDSRIRKIKEVFTDSIDITGRHEDYHVERALIMPEGGFSTATEVVSVHLNFERFRSKTVSGVAITLKGVRDLAVFPGSLEVTVMGPESLLDGISSDDIKVFVDAQGPGKQIMPFFNVPDGIVFKTCNPPRVEVRERKNGNE